MDGPVASLTGDGAYDREDVYGAVAERHPEAAVVVPPRRDAVPSGAAETAPTQRDRHLRSIAERGPHGLAESSGYNRRALAEAAVSRYKRVIGDALRSRTDRRQATEVAIAVQCPEPDAGARPPGVRPHRVSPDGGWGQCVRPADPCTTVSSSRTPPRRPSRFLTSRYRRVRREKEQDGDALGDCGIRGPMVGKWCRSST